jgi:hypothetical protein
MYPVGHFYTSIEIQQAINYTFNSDPILLGSTFSIDLSNNLTMFRLNINKTFTAENYKLVFYDPTNFVRCTAGANSNVQNVTHDSTLGWILGFRNLGEYSLSTANITTSYDNTTYYTPYTDTPFTYNATTNVINITGDTSISINLYSYFLIVLDDFTQNHLNDGLVTITTKDNLISLPSYSSKTAYRCNPVTKSVSVGNINLGNNTTNTNLTANQVYAANQILINQQNEYKQNKYSKGLFVKDLFGLIPMNITKITNGQSFIEYGGSLQLQERMYFGPVNIHRMRVQLLTDRGSTVDLNGANWSFSLIVEQLYNANSA